MKVAFMTQELIDLRTSILEGGYADALAIVDELEEILQRSQFFVPARKRSINQQI